MTKPKVSIIIPTFNRAPLLKESLQSIVDQTFVDYEVLVVDDGSTDTTSDVIASFASPRLRCFLQENKGRSAARNRALAAARGTYIAFLDSDDLFVPSKLEKQVALLDARPDYGMSYTAARVIDENGEELFSPDSPQNREPYYKAIDSGWIYDKIAFYLPTRLLLPTVMIRRTILDAVGMFDEKLHRFEDTDLWRRISKVTQIIALNEPLTTVRTHHGNSMEHPRQVLDSIGYYVEKIKAEDGGDSLNWRQGSAQIYLHYGLAVNATHDHRQYSVAFFQESVRLFPAGTVEYLACHHILDVQSALTLVARNVDFAPLWLLWLLLVTAWKGFRCFCRKPLQWCCRSRVSNV